MIISLAVHGGPYGSSSARSALQFSRAALSRGHELYRVFFYHDGVRAADTLSVTPQDEESLVTQWAALHLDHGVELAVCIAAALKRGVLNEEERARYDRSAANLHPAFEIVGLGQLIDATITSDRFVTFGA